MISPTGQPASSRSVAMNGLRTEAATRADWCQGVAELTTAMRTGCRGPARTPVHSLARP